MKRLILSLLFLSFMVFNGCNTLSSPTTDTNTTDVIYEVIFDSMGGTNIDSLYLANGSYLSIPSVYKEGYTLEGWYTSVNEGVTFDEKWSFTNNTVNSNITLYANWIINQYTITFNSNEGSLVNPITANYGLEVSEPQPPTKEGFSFDGWYTDPGYSQIYNFTTIPATDLTLYAKWIGEEFNLYFFTGVGINVNSVSLSAGDIIVLPEDPLYNGLVFVGWQFRNGNEVIPNLSTMPNEDTTLYAVWDFDSALINNLVIHYHRFENDYGDGWNLWLWPLGGNGSGYEFTETDEFGVFASIDVSETNLSGSGLIGIMIRLNSWEDKDIDIDRYILVFNVDQNNDLHVYIIQGVMEIYYDSEEAQRIIDLF